MHTGHAKKVIPQEKFGRDAENAGLENAEQPTKYGKPNVT